MCYPIYMKYIYANKKKEGESSVRDEYDGNNVTQDYRFYRIIQKVEVEFTLKKMKPGRVLGPDSIPIEVWRNLDKAGLHWLTKVFNKIIMTKKMPKE